MSLVQLLHRSFYSIYSHSSLIRVSTNKMNQQKQHEGHSVSLDTFFSSAVKILRIFSEISEALEEDRRREEDVEEDEDLLSNSLESRRMRLGRGETVFMTALIDDTS